jgi:hypothetical protein
LALKDERASDEIVDVVDMADHVVGDQDIGGFALAREPLATVRSEKFMNRRYADRVGSRYRSIGRVDAEAADAASDEIAQQIAVIAGNLDDEALCAKLIFANQGFDV